MNLLYLISKLIKKLHVPAIKNCDRNKTSKVCSGSHIINTSLGRYSYIGNFCTVINTKIGSFCSIADNCIIGGASHPIEWVSTSPIFYNGKNILDKTFFNHDYKTDKETLIGNDVWIGNNCLLKGGITIANGAIIGMGSVVTKNVGPYEIWAGNPAKLIKYRFDNNTIEYLLKSEWWEWSDIKLEKESVHFNNIEEFIKGQKK